MPGSKGHAFHAFMKKHDFGTRKTPKRSHFSKKNERIWGVLGFRKHKVRRNPCIIGVKIPFDPNIIVLEKGNARQSIAFSFCYFQLFQASPGFSTRLIADLSMGIRQFLLLPNSTMTIFLHIAAECPFILWCWGQMAFWLKWCTDFFALRASEILKHLKSAHFSSKNSCFSVFCGSQSHAFSCKHEMHDLLTLASYLLIVSLSQRRHTQLK